MFICSSSLFLSKFLFYALEFFSRNLCMSFMRSLLTLSGTMDVALGAIS